MVITKAALKQAVRELEVQEPGSSEEVISQRKLEQFEAMELTPQYGTDLAAVLLKLLLHFRRHPSYKQALIDAKGEEYQKRVLEGTEYKPYFYVKFITRNGSSGKE